MSECKCFTCKCTNRINVIADNAARDKHMPTEAELDEAMSLQTDMLVRIEEHSIVRENIFSAIRLGVI